MKKMRTQMTKNMASTIGMTISRPTPPLMSVKFSATKLNML